jgi:hypothetical protein
MRRILFLLALLAATPASAQSTAHPLTKQPSDIVAPARVGPYVRGERHVYGDASAGVSYRYESAAASDSSWATVYYYRESYPATLPVSRMIAAEVREFMATLDYHVRTGEYEQYRMAWSQPDTLRAENQLLPGHKIAYVYVTRGQKYVSTFNVYVSGRTLIKVRGTVPGSQFENTLILGFAEAAPVLTVLTN